MLDLILVIIERKSPSVPSRTRQGNSVSPMVLWLKPRKSRSSPELSPVGHKNRNSKPPNTGGFLFDFSLLHIKITTEYKGKQMSNVYLDNNRIMKKKDVDKKLKKIGTWRDIDTDIKLAVLMVVGLLVATGFVMDKKQPQPKKKPNNNSNKNYNVIWRKIQPSVILYIMYILIGLCQNSISSSHRFFGGFLI